MINFAQELRYALRSLAKSPGFTATAFLTLTLGIGATTSISSLVEAVLLRPMPFRAPGRLVLIKENVNKLSNLMDLPAPDVLTFARGSRAFEQVGGFETDSMELSGAGEPVRIPTARLTAGVFPVLGVNPVLGRTFTEQEDNQGQKVAMISYGLWKSRFQGDPEVLDRRVDLERNPYVIVGVMPRDFEFPLLPGKLSQAELPEIRRPARTPEQPFRREPTAGPRNACTTEEARYLSAHSHRVASPFSHRNSYEHTERPRFGEEGLSFRPRR